METNKKKNDFSQAIPIIEKKLGYVFKDKGLVMQAFTRTSYCNEHSLSKDEKYQSNEVLEFFGDSVLSAAIVTLIIKDFSERYDYGIKTELTEGDFSNIKSKLSDKKNLSDRMRELGLSRFLRMGEGDRKLGVEDEPSVMEDLFESIIGAIYIDSGMDMPIVIKVVSGMLSASEYMKSGAAQKHSAKNALQEWCADKKRRLPPPIYETVAVKGPDHKRVYERSCTIGERRYSVGVGKNQKLADADAAEKALAVLTREEAEKRNPPPDENAVEKLMEFVRSARLPAASFYDLGETEASTPERPSFRVVCRIGETEAEGIAISKKNARSYSAEAMLKKLRKPAETKKESPKKHNAKPKVSTVKRAKNKT